MTDYRKASFAYDQHVDGQRYGRDFANTIIAHFPNGIHDSSAIDELRRFTDHALSTVTGKLSVPFRRSYTDGFNSGLAATYAEHGNTFSTLLDSRHSIE